MNSSSFLTGLFVLFWTVGSSNQTMAFDLATTNAIKACHSYLWNEPEFMDLPNAAISVWPGKVDGDKTTVYWNVDWTDPSLQAAGKCISVDGKVVKFQNYLD